jgi:hypothetical protein
MRRGGNRGGSTRTPGQTAEKEGRRGRRAVEEPPHSRKAQGKKKKEGRIRAVEEPPHSRTDSRKAKARKGKRKKGRWRNHPHSRTDRGRTVRFPKKSGQ